MASETPDIVRFVKMHGAGNDYVYIDGITQPVSPELAASLAAPLSDRHFGIGADGLILYTNSDDAAVRMLMWNADGSRGAMCGNGTRCLAQLVYETGVVTASKFGVQTDSGVRSIDLRIVDGKVARVRVGMGEVVASAEPERAIAGDYEVEFFRGDAGNPHAVVFVDDLADYPVGAVGLGMQTVPAFATGVNVEFVRTTGRDQLEQRTFERGSGETLACGSGATVAALVAQRTGRVKGESIKVQLRGGELVVHARPDQPWLEGPVVRVFDGAIDVRPPHRHSS